MESVANIAKYISKRYKADYGAQIDEMKLNRLLYLIQRESLVSLGEPMFAEQFYAGKYGPILLEVRELLKNDLLSSDLDVQLSDQYVSVINIVFAKYANKSSWSLSRLTHGEYSWQNARHKSDMLGGVDAIISIEDIKADANRIKVRRFFLERIPAASLQF